MLLLNISNPLITDANAVSQIPTDGSSQMPSSLLSDSDSSSSRLDGNSPVKMTGNPVFWRGSVVSGVPKLLSFN